MRSSSSSSMPPSPAPTDEGSMVVTPTKSNRTGGPEESSLMFSTPPGGPATSSIAATPPPPERTSPATPRRKKKQYAVSTQWERQVKANGPVKDVHYYFCCCARRLGNMFVLCARTDGTPIVIAGPCWPFCVGVTLPLILGISGCVAYFVIISDSSPLPFWLAYIYFPALAFVLAALFCVSCQDPGLMERVTDEEAGQGGWFWNEQVGSFRPPGALYCRECGVLIQDYDHLCPWTGTGIGGNNMLAFKVFVVGVNVLCYFSLTLIIVALLWGLAS